MARLLAPVVLAPAALALHEVEIFTSEWAVGVALTRRVDGLAGLEDAIGIADSGAAVAEAQVLTPKQQSRT